MEPRKKQPKRGRSVPEINMQENIPNDICKVKLSYCGQILTFAITDVDSSDSVPCWSQTVTCYNKLRRSMVTFSWCYHHPHHSCGTDHKTPFHWSSSKVPNWGWKPQVGELFIIENIVLLLRHKTNLQQDTLMKIIYKNDTRLERVYSVM